MPTCRLICYIDGACPNNGYADAIGGADVYIPQLNYKSYMGIGASAIPRVTSQRAELIGLIRALNEF